MYAMLTELLSGLALFLFGMNFMSESLQKTAGERLKGILNSVTKNKYVAVVFGALFTAIIQSSGATTVMEVSFVNAGIMSLEQSVGITFGANIGTTITSQLVSLKLTAIAPFIIFIGAALIMFGKNPSFRKISEIIFGFGALFLGINFMTGALGNLQNYPSIVHIFTYLDNPIIAILLGFALTVIVQSSSVTVSVLVLLADSGLVALLGCLYFILGANIGSCTPAVVASMSSNAEAKRTATIHALFNIIGMIVISIILLFASHPVVNLLSAISGVGNAKRFVANADTLFKCFQTIMLLPVSDGLIKLSKIIVKDENGFVDETKKRLLYIRRSNEFIESTAVIDSTEEIARMACMVQDNLHMIMDAVNTGNLNKKKAIYDQEEYIDYLSHEITEYLVEVNKYTLSAGAVNTIGGLFKVITDIERIGDRIINILEQQVNLDAQRITFTNEAQRELKSISLDTLTIYDQAIEMFASGKKENIVALDELENEIDLQQKQYQEEHIRRMSIGTCSIEAGLIFVEILSNLERIADHSRNIAYFVVRH